MFIDFRYRERVRGERQTDIDVRNINQLPPICALARNRLCNLGM